MRVHFDDTRGFDQLSIRIDGEASVCTPRSSEELSKQVSQIDQVLVVVLFSWSVTDRVALDRLLEYEKELTTPGLEVCAVAATAPILARLNASRQIATATRTPYWILFKEGVILDAVFGPLPPEEIVEWLRGLL